MRTLVIALSAFGLLAASTASVAAAPCRDAHGRFMKCPAKPAPKANPKQCRDAKGKFIKCKK
jgi:hypothetical protein